MLTACSILSLLRGCTMGLNDPNPYSIGAYFIGDFVLTEPHILRKHARVAGIEVLRPKSTDGFQGSRNPFCALKYDSESYPARRESQRAEDSTGIGSFAGQLEELKGR
jgi:hypothetical protein